MHPRQKKKVFLYAGIGFVSIGILSIVLMYMFLYWWTSITHRLQAKEGRGNFDSKCCVMSGFQGITTSSGGSEIGQAPRGQLEATELSRLSKERAQRSPIRNMQCCRSSGSATTVVGEKPHHHSQLSRLNHWRVLEILRNMIKAMVQGYVSPKRSSIESFSAYFFWLDVSVFRASRKILEAGMKSPTIRTNYDLFGSVVCLFLELPRSMLVTISS